MTPPLGLSRGRPFLRRRSVLSGLIALAYSLCGVEFVVLRGLYPGLWRDVRIFAETARKELAPMTQAAQSYIELLAGSIPLVAAMLIAALVGDATTVTFRWLVVGTDRLGHDWLSRHQRSHRQSVASRRRAHQHQGVSVAERSAQCRRGRI